MSYIQGFLLAVPEARKADYIEMTRAVWPFFEKHGAISSMECWGDDVPDGKVTSFPMAVKLEPGEVVVFSWIEWPDHASYLRAAAAMENDPEMEAPAEMPFDGMRMMWGGFTPIFNSRAPS